MATVWVNTLWYPGSSVVLLTNGHRYLGIHHVDVVLGHLRGLGDSGSLSLKTLTLT